MTPTIPEIGPLHDRADPGIDWRAARSLAGLKYRIIRHSPQAIVGMVLGLLLGGGLGLAAIGGIIAMRDLAERGDLLTVGACILLVLWALAPLVVGGGELILDLRTLAVYPLNLNTLVVGLLLAAVVGVPFLITLVVAATVASHATGAVSVVILLIAAVQLAVTAVLIGRVSVAMVSLLTSTRFRSVAGGITVLAAITLGISSQLIAVAIDDIELSWFTPVRRVMRFLPIGWTPEAMANASTGRLGPALVFLLLGATVPFALLRIWRAALTRQLDGQSAQSKVKDTKPLVSPWMDRLVDRRTAAVWAKSARAIRRDVREWTEIAAFLPLILAFTLPTLVELDARDSRLVLAPFLAAVSGATMTSTNLFGGDGPRFTADAFPGEDLRPVLLGKLLPRLILVTIIVLFGTVLLAVLMGGWRYLPLSVLLIAQSLLLGSAAGWFVTIRSPIPLPEKLGGFNAANAGCIAPLFQLFALLVADLVAIVLAAPAIVTTLMVNPWVAMVFPVVTIPITIWMINRRLDSEARFARARIPEITAALARRT